MSDVCLELNTTEEATFSWIYLGNSFIMHSNFSERTSSIKLEMVRIVRRGLGLEPGGLTVESIN